VTLKAHEASVLRLVRARRGHGEERDPHVRAIDAEHHVGAALVPRRAIRRLRSLLFSAVALALAELVVPIPAQADLLPLSPLPPDRSLWVNFEILPAEAAKPLPESMKTVEGARLKTEEAVVSGQTYRKTSVTVSLPNGDRREMILLLAVESEHMRMLGFHHILRHQESPHGGTTVFQSGQPNPLTGDPIEVPADTYTYLALCTALSGLGGARPPLALHLWSNGAATPVEIVFDGKETLDVLGERLPALRIRLASKSGAPAVYWFAEADPHALLQYRGPGDFLIGQGDPVPTVLLRATASSEQIRRIFHD
jgi:hypothetical protein